MTSVYTRSLYTYICVALDELDSIGRSRRLGSMNSEQESTLNQVGYIYIYVV